MKKHLITAIAIFCAVLLLPYSSLLAQNTNRDSTFKRHFISSSLFMLANALPNPPSFYQINYGYRLTSKDVISVEAITWIYDAPLGIPYGSSHNSSLEKYPGSIKGIGLGLAYQRYLWKNVYSAIHATPLLQTYRNEHKEKIQNGFQLFCTLRVGYHLKLFKNRLFLEPSIAATYFPIETNMPQSFRVKENKWPNYFLLEPGLHFGVNF